MAFADRDPSSRSDTCNSRPRAKREQILRMGWLVSESSDLLVIRPVVRKNPDTLYRWKRLPKVPGEKGEPWWEEVL